MRDVNLSSIDLNLLVALDALLRERHVTRAAQNVGLSQPAMSRALGRLRVMFDDPILVRTTAGMVATPRAQALLEPLTLVLSAVEHMVKPPTFDPVTAKGTVSIVTTDYVSLILMPNVLLRLRGEAPGLDVEIQGTPSDALTMLESGACDLSIGVYSDAPSGYFRQGLFTEELACLVRADHPVIGAELTLDSFADMPHALITVTGEGPGVVDKILTDQKKSRRVALRIPHFMAAPAVVAATDLIVTLPRRLAQRFAELADLAVLDPPFERREFQMALLWHERRHADPAHMWLRKQIADAAHGI